MHIFTAFLLSLTFYFVCIILKDHNISLGDIKTLRDDRVSVRDIKTLRCNEDYYFTRGVLADSILPHPGNLQIYIICFDLCLRFKSHYDAVQDLFMEQRLEESSAGDTHAWCPPRGRCPSFCRWTRCRRRTRSPISKFNESSQPFL